MRTTSRGKRQLRRAVRDLHDCDSAWLESVLVSETFEGQTAWEGEVHVFELHGHPTATRCYAWASPIEGSDRLRYYAVLHEPPVDSPKVAVRAAIVLDHRKGGKQ